MDTLTNLKAFLAVARTGSFAGAARDLRVAPSVVTKRISQIEWRLKTPLFERSTRRVSLTPLGLRYLPAVQRAVADMEELFAELPAAGGDLQGRLRIKAPGTLAAVLMGPLLAQFQTLYPLVSLELLTLDRPVNPVDEGFDMVLTMLPDTYAGVIDEPLCAMSRSICASPEYVHSRGLPQHPSDLLAHDVLNFLPTGSVWAFESNSGEIQVRVQPRLNTNEGRLLLAGALAGDGIARLGAYLCEEHLKSGALIPMLTGYTIKTLWLKALIPESRIQVARVQALVQFLKLSLGQVAPS